MKVKLPRPFEPPLIYIRRGYEGAHAGCETKTAALVFNRPGLKCRTARLLGTCELSSCSPDQHLTCCLPTSLPRVSWPRYSSQDRSLLHQTERLAATATFSFTSSWRELKNSHFQPQTSFPRFANSPQPGAAKMLLPDADPAGSITESAPADRAYRPRALLTCGGDAEHTTRGAPLCVASAI